MSVEDQFEGDERALLKRIQELLDVRMKDKRKRYVHSLGVAETALHLAEVYGVDRFDAAAAGLIHDWDKVLSDDDRHGDYAHALRKMVGKSSLDELFFSCFAQGLVYVIQSGRYLYPTAISIYNHYAQLR